MSLQSSIVRRRKWLSEVRLWKVRPKVESSLEWYINGEGEGYGLYFAVMEFDIFEVVGNTYENPYLIKE